MMLLRTFVAAAAFLASSAAPAAPRLGADFSPEELASRGQFVKGLIPVHGFWVNWTDVYFYSGDVAALNGFLAAVAKDETAAAPRLVVHAGAARVRSPWDKEDRPTAADWTYTVGNGEMRKTSPMSVDVWIGSKIKLDSLTPPAAWRVESGGEIERFVASHAARERK